MELRARGYSEATSAHHLKQAETKDVPWLTWLRDNIDGPYVLVTYDNKMPVEHATTLRECGTTVAVIDKDGWPSTGLEQEAYWREVIHRHAHRFFVQAPASRYRYRCSNRRTAVRL